MVATLRRGLKAVGALGIAALVGAGCAGTENSPALAEITPEPVEIAEIFTKSADESPIPTPQVPVLLGIDEAAAAALVPPEDRVRSATGRRRRGSDLNRS